MHDYLHASLPIIVHKLEDDGLRSRLCVASGLVHLEAPEVLPLELGEWVHRNGGKREIEQSGKLNDRGSKTSNLELLNGVDGNRHLFIRMKKVRTAQFKTNKDNIAYTSLESQNHTSHAYMKP